MLELSQEERLLQISDVVPGAKLVVTRVDVDAAVSEPYRISVDIVADDPAVDPLKVIGKSASVTVAMSDDSKCAFHGIVASIAQADTFEIENTALRSYQLVMVPAFSLLKHQTNCRVFQEKTFPDVVEQVLKDGGVTFASKLKGSYAKEEYCVQYQETDYDFVCRLMEEAGIFYYCTHTDSDHKMNLGDAGSAYTDAGKIRFAGDSQFAEEAVTSWVHNYALHSTAAQIRSYDFENPASPVEAKEKTKLKTKTPEPLEYFEYAEVIPAKDAKSLAVARIEVEEAQHHTISGEGSNVTILPGTKIKLVDHPSDAENKLQVAIRSARHLAEQPLIPGSSDLQFRIESVFEGVPADTPMRPLRVRNRPLAVGPQPAKVVGAKGDEILTDKYGRVKIQFPWDREGKYDDKSSCFVRVAQGWAGGSRGMQFLPRVGDEVLVEFLGGNPSRPIITGSVYNGTNKTPWKLPDDAHISGIKTYSTDKGKAKNFSELSFHDQIGKEKIYFHAERDYERLVENDERIKIGFDSKDKGDSTVDIYNDRTVTLDKGKDTLNVTTGDRLVNIDKGNQVVSIKQGDHKIKVEAGQHVVEAGKCISFKVGGSTLKIEANAITIKTPELKMQANIKAVLKAPMLTLSGDAMTTIKGGLVKIN